MSQASRVLVIEDDETLRETLGEVLADEGHEVRLAGDGVQALESLDGWHPDLMILDLMMPRMDAFAFREHQQRTGAAPTARVLVLSAARDIEVAASRIRADAWLAKPFTLAEMMDVVDGLLAGFTPHRS